MSDLTNYLVSYAILLSVGMIVLRVLLRYDYQSQGRLSVHTAIIQALFWFIYGSFPLFYVPEGWPVTSTF